MGWSPPPAGDDSPFVQSAVSIPERVWGGLEPGNRKIHQGLEKFQSLRGFGVGWSHHGSPLANQHGGTRKVSIPERVWGGLEPAPEILEPVASQTRKVSIPERVWGGLEQQPYRLVNPRLWRFNP